MRNFSKGSFRKEFFLLHNLNSPRDYFSSNNTSTDTLFTRKMVHTTSLALIECYVYQIYLHIYFQAYKVTASKQLETKAYLRHISLNTFKRTDNLQHKSNGKCECAQYREKRRGEINLSVKILKKIINSGQYVYLIYESSSLSLVHFKVAPTSSDGGKL
jgi:hypothetical protein